MIMIGIQDKGKAGIEDDTASRNDSSMGVVVADIGFVIIGWFRRMKTRSQLAIFIFSSSSQLQWLCI